jgi:hypothetical protein
MFDDDNDEVGMSVITPNQFKAKESYWANQPNDVPNDSGFVLWSSLGRRVVEEAPYRTLPFDPF